MSISGQDKVKIPENVSHDHKVHDYSIGIYGVYANYERVLLVLVLSCPNYNHLGVDPLICPQGLLHVSVGDWQQYGTEMSTCKA